MIYGCMADSPGSRLSEVAGVRGGGDCERHSHRQPVQDLVVKTKVVKTNKRCMNFTLHYRGQFENTKSLTIVLKPYGFNRQTRDARTGESSD